MTGLICCTLKCNLACSYCYEGNGRIHEYPKVEEINKEFQNAKNNIIKFIDELYEYNDEGFTKVIWHGGEPTLINFELLNSIMEDQAKKGHSIHWSMQSNGTLLTNKYIDVLKKHSVSIGISLDGLKEQHDAYRVFKNGNPTFDIIMENIERLQDRGVRCGTLITITDNNVNDLIDIYKMFAEKKLSFNFNALFPDKEGRGAKLNVNEYATRICELFDYWIQDEEHNIMISPFVHIIEGLLKSQRGIPACHWSKNCSKGFVAIDTKGNLYPCEHWVGIKEFCFGNIENGLQQELKNCNYFFDRKNILETTDCRGCDIWHLCYGGCPWNAWTLFDNVNCKDASICQGRKMIINHIKDYLTQNKKMQS